MTLIQIIEVCFITLPLPPPEATTVTTKAESQCCRGCGVVGMKLGNDSSSF